MKKLTASVAIILILGGCNLTLSNQAQLKFETDTVNLGNLKCDTNIIVNCKYRNIGGTDLVIKNITTSCDCLIPSFSTKGLGENQSDSFSISYHTSKEIEGLFVKSISVLSTGKQ